MAICLFLTHGEKMKVMNINIYGVGRSGTKAVQLYLAYLLAEEYGSVRLNYEPYFWQTRLTNSVSFEGLRYHLESPQFCSNVSDFSTQHIKYLNRLTDKGDMPVVTKFIRGNGRISVIDDIMKPDHSVLVIRNVYEVLESLLLMDWDFFSVGYPYFNHSYVSYWGQIEQYLEDLSDFPWKKDLPTFVYDRIIKNACYWYAMNRSALEQLPSGGLVLQYENISTLEGWAKKKLGIQSNVRSISDPMFRGENIHENFPLNDISLSNFFSWVERWNEMHFYYISRNNKFKWIPIATSNIGSISSISKSAPNSNAINNNLKIKIKLPPHPVLDYLNQDIAERIKSHPIAQ